MNNTSFTFDNGYNASNSNNVKGWQPQPIKRVTANISGKLNTEDPTQKIIEMNRRKNLG